MRLPGTDGTDGPGDLGSLGSMGDGRDGRIARAVRIVTKSDFDHRGRHSWRPLFLARPNFLQFDLIGA